MPSVAPPPAGVGTGVLRGASDVIPQQGVRPLQGEPGGELEPHLGHTRGSLGGDCGTARYANNLVVNCKGIDDFVSKLTPTIFCSNNLLQGYS